MAESKTRTVFFPYLFGDQGLSVRLVSCVLDGQPADSVWHQDSLECDLSSNSTWKRADLTFDVTPEPDGGWIPDYVPVSERQDPPVQVIATMHCQKTLAKTRWLGSMDLASRTARVHLDLERASLRGSVEVAFFVVRTESQATDMTCAGDAGARLMSSRVIQVLVDERVDRPGPGLDIKWENFSGSQHLYRLAYPTALFHLDLESREEPTLYLNSDADPDLCAVLKEQAPGGRRAVVRNVVFAGIGIPVWNCLLRAALGAVSSEDDQVAPGWERNVLVHIARVAEPGCADEEAVRRFVGGMKLPQKQIAMEQQLPVILSELVMLRERAEKVMGVLR